MIGGLSGIVIAIPPVDIHLHDTYYIVAHFHYVLFGASLLGVFGAIYFWYPKMFGRKMSEWLGKAHFLTTFIFFNLTFFPMHFFGLRGMPRRYANPIQGEFANLTQLNEFVTYSAFAMGAVQLIFVLNFFGSLLFGKKVGRNPWKSNTLEWTAPSPPGHGNFDAQPIVYRGPYEYCSPECEEDYWPQTQPESN